MHALFWQYNAVKDLEILRSSLTEKTAHPVLTRRVAGEALRERLCLGRLRGGEYCLLPRNALFPLL